MDDRELDSRLGIIEQALATIMERMENIESILQQYWEDNAGDEEEEEEEEEKSSKVKIKSKSEDE